MLVAGTIEQRIREFILANFLYGRVRSVKDDDRLAAEGIIDSTGVLQLVAFLEQTYGISVEDEELTPENLDSISSIVAYLSRKGVSIAASRAEGESSDEEQT